MVKEMSGQRFGSLTVVSFSHTVKTHSFWKCKCDCGTELLVRRNSLVSGSQKSCGCSRKKKWEPIFREDGTALIPLSRGFNAVVDSEDVPKLLHTSWYCTQSREFLNYAVSEVGKKTVIMSRLILGATGRVDVDHINHDTLDNRKCNLRIVTHSQNCMNRLTRAKGYSLRKSGSMKGKWAAYIRVNQVLLHLGFFDEEKGAIEARKIAEQKYFGEFSCKEKYL